MKTVPTYLSVYQMSSLSLNDIFSCITGYFTTERLRKDCHMAASFWGAQIFPSFVPGFHICFPWLMLFSGLVFTIGFLWLIVFSLFSTRLISLVDTASLLGPNIYIFDNHVIYSSRVESLTGPSHFRSVAVGGGPVSWLAPVSVVPELLYAHWSGHFAKILPLQRAGSCAYHITYAGKKRHFKNFLFWKVGSQVSY